jgi:hypothetical protein
MRRTSMKDILNEINQKLFPESEEIFGWIKDLTSLGHRMTGTPEGKKSADYIQDKMKSFGLSDVTIEKVPSVCLSTEICQLEIGGEKVDTYFINGTNRHAETGIFEFNTPIEGSPILYLGEGNLEDFEDVEVAGKIVVCDIRFLDGNIKTMIDWNKNSDYIYDPRGTLDHKKNKFDIYSPCNWPNNYFYAMKKGAAGFVGILENYMDSCVYYNEDYTEIGLSFGTEYMKIPGMWVSRSDGKVVRERIKQKDTDKSSAECIMHMKSIYEKKDALNIHGRLIGKSEDMILIHSHHDAVFNGAVQDGSGVSEMLALAKYFSQIPADNREKTLMFAATDTHYTDYLGHQGFIKAREGSGDRLIIDVAIEHIGKEIELDDKGRAVVTGEVEARVFYVSDEQGLQQITRDAIEKYNLERSIIFPISKPKKQEGENYQFQQDEVISDAYYFHQAGIPVISMVCPEMYLFHPMDTSEMVPVEQLKPVGMAFAEIVTKISKIL